MPEYIARFQILAGQDPYRIMEGMMHELGYDISGEKRFLVSTTHTLNEPRDGVPAWVEVDFSTSIPLGKDDLSRLKASCDIYQEL